MMTLPRTAFLFLLAAATGACTSPPAPEGAAPGADPFAPPSSLAAALVDGGHIDVKWRNNGSLQTGSFLEFNMNPGEEFGLLEIVGVDVASLRHPDVAPETRFSYRVRPVFGQASEPAEVATGAAPPEDAPLLEEGPLPGTPEPEPVTKSSVRGAATQAGARPTGLRASLAAPTAVDLRWQDRADDEEGYLAEMSVAGGPFATVAMLPPDTTSFRKVRAPAESRLAFRVRAYFLGTPSETVTVATPARP